MADYRKLLVWQKSRVLVKQIYQHTKTFPSYETFGLVNQMRRAAVSILSNIAEGCGRQSDKEFIQFLHIAKGSLFEVESQLYVAMDLGYIKEIDLKETEALCEEVGQMISGLLYVIIERQRQAVSIHDGEK